MVWKAKKENKTWAKLRPGQKITVRSKAICGEKLGSGYELYKAIVLAEFKRFFLIEVVFENGHRFKSSISKVDLETGSCKVVLGW